MSTRFKYSRIPIDPLCRPQSNLRSLRHPSLLQTISGFTRTSGSTVESSHDSVISLSHGLAVAGHRITPSIFLYYKFCKMRILLPKLQKYKLITERPGIISPTPTLLLFWSIFQKLRTSSLCLGKSRSSGVKTSIVMAT